MDERGRLVRTLPIFRARGAKGGNGATSRAALDAAAFAKGELVELFTARGCTMIVPAADVPLALAAAKVGHAEKTKKIVAGEGLAAAERSALEKAILAALAKGGKDAAELRAAIPKNLVRSFGEAGRRLGESSRSSSRCATSRCAASCGGSSAAGGSTATTSSSGSLGKGSLGRRRSPEGATTLLRELARRFWHGRLGVAARARLLGGHPTKEAAAAAESAGAVRALVPELGEMWVLESDLAPLEARERGGGPRRALPALPG